MADEPYIIGDVVQWGPFQGARREDLLDEEWNCDAIVPHGDLAQESERRWMIEQARLNEARTLEAVYGKQD